MDSWSAEELAAQVRSDLESSGFPQVPQEKVDAEEGGAVVWASEGEVHVVWATHDRLERAAEDKLEAGHGPASGVVLQYQTVRAAMHLALGSILHAFGYQLSVGGFGFGYILDPANQGLRTRAPKTTPSRKA